MSESFKQELKRLASYQSEYVCKLTGWLAAPYWVIRRELWSLFELEQAIELGELGELEETGEEYSCLT